MRLALRLALRREQVTRDPHVHISALEAAGIASLREGQKVSFDVQPDARGPKAVNIQAS